MKHHSFQISYLVETHTSIRQVDYLEKIQEFS